MMLAVEPVLHLVQDLERSLAQGKRVSLRR